MIAQAISPTVWSVIADAYGRRTTYIFTFIVFISACIGLAVLQQYDQLVILRALQSAGSASTVAIGAGVIGDITTREERGGYMGIFQAGTLGPVAIGPIIGGALANSLGWRAIFWFLTIYGGAFLLVLIILLPETLRSLVGNGSIPPKGLAKSPLGWLQRRRHHRRRGSDVSARPKMTAPTKPKLDIFASFDVLFSLEAAPVIIFLSIHYAAWQGAVVSMSSIFTEFYGLTVLENGLTYIANGVGSIIGTASVGKWLDRDYRLAKEKYGGDKGSDFPLERTRLRTLWLFSLLHVLSLVAFGWTLDRRVHISAPIIFSFFFGWAATSIQGITTTYLVDLNPKRSASAAAALNLARCLMGAGATSFILPLTGAISVGWGFTLVALVCAASYSLVLFTLRFVPARRRRREMEAKTG